MYTKEHLFDSKIVDRINNYIKENMLSISLVAKKAGYTYNQLYQILHKNQLLKLEDYMIICDALGVDFNFFIGPKITPVPNNNSGDVDYFEPF